MSCSRRSLLGAVAGLALLRVVPAVASPAALFPGEHDEPTLPPEVSEWPRRRVVYLFRDRGPLLEPLSAHAGSWVTHPWWSVPPAERVVVAGDAE